MEGHSTIRFRHHTFGQGANIMLCKLLVRVLGVGSGRVMVAKVDESNVTGRGGGKQGLGFVEVGILFKLEEAQSSDSKPARLLHSLAYLLSRRPFNAGASACQI